MGDGQGQMGPGQSVGHEDQGQDGHDIAQDPPGALQGDDGQHRAGEGGHPGGLAQPLGHVVDLILGHPPGDPGQDHQRDVDGAAEGAEDLAPGELVLEHMLIQRLGQQDQGEGEAQMDAALGHEVLQTVHTGVDVEQRHGEGHHGGDLDVQVALALLQGLSRGQLAVQGRYVYLLELFVFFSHKSVLSPIPFSSSIPF